MLGAMGVSCLYYLVLHVLMYVQSPQGVLGSLFIQANIRIAVYREKTSLKQWPVFEVIAISTITAIISFLVS